MGSLPKKKKNSRERFIKLVYQKLTELWTVCHVLICTLLSKKKKDGGYVNQIH